MSKTTSLQYATEFRMLENGPTTIGLNMSEDTVCALKCTVKGGILVVNFYYIEDIDFERSEKNLPRNQRNNWVIKRRMLTFLKRLVEQGLVFTAALQGAIDAMMKMLNIADNKLENIYTVHHLDKDEADFMYWKRVAEEAKGKPKRFFIQTDLSQCPFDGKPLLSNGHVLMLYDYDYSAIDPSLKPRTGVLGVSIDGGDVTFYTKEAFRDIEDWQKDKVGLDRIRKFVDDLLGKFQVPKGVLDAIELMKEEPHPVAENKTLFSPVWLYNEIKRFRERCEPGSVFFRPLGSNPSDSPADPATPATPATPADPATPATPAVPVTQSRKRSRDSRDSDNDKLRDCKRRSWKKNRAVQEECLKLSRVIDNSNLPEYLKDKLLEAMFGN